MFLLFFIRTWFQMQFVRGANFLFPKGRGKGNKIKKRITSRVDWVPGRVISILIVKSLPFHTYSLLSTALSCGSM